MSDFLQLAKERVVVYDGAMGTNIQKRNPTLDDYWGKENCNEILGAWILSGQSLTVWGPRREKATCQLDTHPDGSPGPMAIGRRRIPGGLRDWTQTLHLRKAVVTLLDAFGLWSEK